MRYMNAKEEAKDLIGKYAFHTLRDFSDENFEETRQCALVAVDKILDFITYNVVPYTYDKDSMKAVISNKQHYIKVKQEIEKL
jgi:hypothetical protein